MSSDEQNAEQEIETMYVQTVAAFAYDGPSLTIEGRAVDAPLPGPRRQGGRHVSAQDFVRL